MSFILRPRREVASTPTTLLSMLLDQNETIFLPSNFADTISSMLPIQRSVATVSSVTTPLGTHKPYMSHPSRPSSERLLPADSWGARSLSYGVRVATFASNSTSSHNSSSSISEGFNRPPTFMARSRSCSFAVFAACSRSSRNNSALSPENSFKEIKKSRRMTLKRLRSELVAKSPSMNDAIWAL